MINISIGGVPEHFNYPWYVTLKNKVYTKHGINVRWTDYPGGTGQMCTALRNSDVDIAIVLTEGIIKDIINGNPSKIVQPFVSSPLTWGIHVSASSQYDSIDDIENKVIAISRYGSGSHLMAIVNAYNQNWDIKNLNFKVVNDLEGGINALKNKSADYFMWEKFTTQPWVDNGTFRRIDLCPTPWPCFMIAVRNELLNKNSKEIKLILEEINLVTSSFKETPNLSNTLSERYNLKEHDVKEWLQNTEWNSTPNVNPNLIEDVQNKLLRFGVIKETKNTFEFIKNVYF